MEALAPPPKGTVVAAVALDSQSGCVADTAAALARRFDMDLRLVHVIEEEPLQPWVVEVPGYYYSLPIPEDALAARVADGRAKLAKLVEATHLGGRARGEVLVGDTEEALISYSKLHRANLLVTSCASEYGDFTGFLSTTIALMAHAPLPVLVVDTGRTPDFTRPGLAILVGDDLEAGSQEALRRTFELASKMPGSRVRQVNVHGRRRPLLHADADLLARDHEARRAKLCERGQPFRDRVAAKTDIEVDIREGDVVRELTASMADFKPDLLVVGRHKALKLRPFLIGKVPFRQTLKGPCAVLVVPPPEELYANLAFPAT